MAHSKASLRCWRPGCWGTLHCYWCGRKFTPPYKAAPLHDRLTRDHLIPRTWYDRRHERGERGKIVAACAECNSSRDDEHAGQGQPWVPFHEWRRSGVSGVPPEQLSAIRRVRVLSVRTK